MKTRIDIDLNRDNIIEMLQNVNRDTDAIIEFLDNSDYFVSPASTRHHLNCKGGLAQHSLNVADILVKWNNDYKLELDNDSLRVIGLLHDICKINTYSINYLKNGNVGKTPFNKFDKLPMGHSEKSVILANKYIDLTEDEMLAIRWHSLNYDPAYRLYQSVLDKSSEYVIITHLADMFASKYIDDTYEGEIE